MTQGLDDVDPTGVRRVLRSLPAPGPMPDDVTARILEALRREPPGDQLTEVEHLPFEQSAAGMFFGDRDDDLSDGGTGQAGLVTIAGFGQRSRRSMRRRRPTWPFIAAAAASLVGLVIGAAVLASGRRAASLTASVPPASHTVSTGATAAPTSGAKIQIQASSRTYSSARLALQAQELLDQPAPSPQPADPALGALGTPDGLAACIATLGEDGADQVTVDFAVYDGQPAAIIVAVTGGVRRVYVVQRSCSQGDPAILQEPVPMN